MLGWSRCERKFGPLIAERRAGALAAADAEALERHLQDCDRCRAWETEMGQLAQGLRHASHAGGLDHPAPRALAALFSGAGLSAEERAGLERHVEGCADCRTEWNVATRWNPGRLPSAAPLPPARWSWFAAGAVSAAAAAMLLVVVLPRAPSAIDARSALASVGAPVQVRGAHHRAASDATPLPVSAGAEVVVVALTVEAPAGSRLEVELRDDVAAVLATAELMLDDPSGLVMLSVTASRLPEGAGEFRVRVADTGESFRYPFRVETRGD